MRRLIENVFAFLVAVFAIGTLITCPYTCPRMVMQGLSDGQKANCE